MGIAQWQAGEGPRDKLLERGEQALSDAGRTVGDPVRAAQA